MPISQWRCIAIPGAVPIRAIRIRPTTPLAHPLAIREIKIESEPPIDVFRYPVEFIVDTADAPELKVWAEKVARTCERWYPMINDELQSDGYKPPAAFLAFVGIKYDKKLVRKLNALLRAGKYSDDDFERLTGKNLKQLDEEWRATLRK